MGGGSKQWEAEAEAERRRSPGRVKKPWPVMKCCRWITSEGNRGRKCKSRGHSYRGQSTELRQDPGSHREPWRGCKAEQQSARSQALERQLSWKCAGGGERALREATEAYFLCLELEKQWNEKRRLDVNNFTMWN